MSFEKELAVRPNKVIYKDGDMVLKVFGENFSKADILNEALNQARVEETGLNIPALNEVTKIDGKWVIKIDYIEGKTLAELMEENPDKEDEYSKCSSIFRWRFRVIRRRCSISLRTR